MTSGTIDEPDGATPLVPPDVPPAPAGEGVVHRRSLLRNAGALLGGQATTWLITTFVLVIVYRRVGKEAIGAYGTATAAWAIAAMMMAFGTTTLVTLDAARRREGPTVSLGPVVACRALGFVIVLPVVATFAWLADYSNEVLVLMGIAAVGTLVASTGEVAGAALTGLERLGPVAVGDVVGKLVAAILMVTTVLITRDIRIVAIAAVLAASVSVVYLYWSLRRLKPIDLSVSRRDVREVIRRGSPYLVIGITLVAYNQIDVLVMSLIVSEAEVGWYRSADQLFGSLLFVPTIVMSAILPTLARRHQDDPGHATDTLVRIFMIVTLVSVPMGLGTFVIAQPLAPLLLSQDFDGSGPVLAVFGLVLMLTFQTILLGQHAIATGRQRMWNIVLAVCIPLTIVFDLIAVPIMHDRYGNGAIAGALAYIITEGLMVVIGIWKLAPELASKPVVRRAFKTLVAGGVLVAWAWPLREEFIGFPIAAGAAGYIIVLLLLRPFEPYELALADRLLSRVPLARRLMG